jgi:tRNA (cmo5U34)-methyltransferase
LNREISMSEWQDTEHALAYLQRADRIPHRVAGESALLDEIPLDARRLLDLGAGDGRLLALALLARPLARGVAVDFSPPLLERLRARFRSDERVEIVEHDLEKPLPALGVFDAVVSSFAIHHLPHERKRKLYEEAWTALAPGGVLCNLEHVASPTARVHDRFPRAMGTTSADEDKSNKLLDMETQLRWLREIGFADVDCYWKWRELALLVGTKSGDS